LFCLFVCYIQMARIAPAPGHNGECDLVTTEAVTRS
jgi:hypothetical protein